MADKNEWKKCDGCGKEMDLLVLEFHVIFNDGEKGDYCDECVKGYFEEIAGEIISVEAI